MNKYSCIALIVISTALAACTIPIGTSMQDVPAASQVPLGTPEIQSTATPIPSWTPEPSATVGYQATAVFAQQTADTAMRLMVDATASAEQRRHEEMSWTVTAEWIEYVIWQERATAAGTSVPATQTQLAWNQKKYATEAIMQMTAQAMTIAAPTQLVAIANAESEAKYSGLRTLVSIFSLGAFGLFFLILVRWMVMRADQLLEHPPRVHAGAGLVGESGELGGTLLTVRRENHGYPRAQRLIVPCSPEQLTALADGLITEHKSLAINQWEGAGQPFTRNSYGQVRFFLLSNLLAVHTPSNVLILTAEGESFFRGWLDVRSVPPPFILKPMDEEITVEATHAHENHAYEPEGEGDSGIAPAGYQPINTEGVKP